MDSQRIQGEDYIVQFNADSTTVHFKGVLSLSGSPEYAPISDLLAQITELEPSAMTLDVRELEFLNSSGISMLSKFVLGLRKKPNLNLTIFGSHEIPWQGKSLKNLERLLPSLTLVFE